MSSILRAAWRVVARRARADRMVLLAVFMTTLMAVTLISAGPIYAGATTTSSLQRTLVDAPVEDSSVIVETRVTGEDLAEADATVIDAIEDIFGSDGANTYRRATSDSFSISGVGAATDADLFVFRTYTGMEERAKLLDGRWPASGSGPIEAAILRSVAGAFSLESGSVFDVASRSNPGTVYQVEVVGVYEITDTADPYWLEDELDLGGVSESSSFITHGPLVVDSTTYFSTVGAGSSKMRWSAFPVVELIAVDDISAIVSSLSNLDDELNADREVGNQMQVSSGLDTVLRDTIRALLVTRSAVLTISVQLAVLAAYALLLAAGLLADTREIESATISARGASTGQLVSMAAMEGLLLAVPALVLGPFLASWALRLFNLFGPLADIGLSIDPRLSSQAWALAAIAALACVFAIVIPAYLATRRIGSVRARRSREEASLARRYGVDLALLAIAGLGIWQLARYGTAITKTVRGSLGIDPLLVAAPALALLAGSVLALRLFPMLARLADRPARRSESLVGPLGIWHLGRQPRRYTRSALMLILALAIGVFALGYSQTWTDSQAEQAGFTAGADLDVVPSQVAGIAIPPQFLVDAHTDIGGVAQSTPALRSSGELAGLDQPVEFLLIEPEIASQIVEFRPDLANEPLSELLAPLADARPSLPGILLPGEPGHLAVTTTFRIDPPELAPDDTLSNYPRGWYLYQPSLRAVMVDARGLIFRVDLGELAPTATPVEMRARIGFPTTGGGFSPEYPISLVGLEISGDAPFAGLEQKATLDIESMSVSTDGFNWTMVDTDMGNATGSVSELRLASTPPTVAIDSREGLLLIISTGATTAQTRQPVYHAVWAGELPDVTDLLVIVDADLARSLQVQVDDAVPLEDLPEFGGTGTVSGLVEAFPTVDPNEAHVIIADLASYHAALLGPGTSPPPPSDFWIALEPGADEAAVVAGLANEPFLSPVITSQSQIEQDLTLDPVSLGTIGSLLAGLVAGLLLAGIGFLVNVAVSGRERMGEFALMKAVGMRSSHVLRWVNVENGATVGFGALFGVLLGVGLSWLVLPLTAVSEDATSVVPALVVRFPWPTVVGLVVFALILLVIASTMVARLVRRLNVASLLRGAGD